MPTVLVTGSNRGLGLEFVRQYAADGWSVIATCREPERADALNDVAGDVTVVAMPVDDDARVRAVAAELAGTAIDVLVNNAGTYGPRGLAFGDLDADAWSGVFRINAIAPLKVSEAFIDHVRAGQQKKIAVVSSKMGSIADNGSGGSYIYRSGKAALNAAAKSLAIDLEGEGISVAILHPGWVRTDMGGPDALIDAQQSVAGMRGVIESLDLASTGRFRNYDGTEIPW